ncbi:glycosyltransferase involved in cell wall biosynthesis [Paenibacillus endophyticus]|uniref:Glycosyltransferase involved in cell wall biosynthesis n=1 Tax=Paenibacillus endophyticus TaxID=1294268 RepID=A0A7W5C355_9BACL|nr:glycosyltransferase family 1 protein [Paenibacillus endophyticus]MBB3150037.1 glycosyltransferase involved in cell wall biosynthesis [Paenibacillus endophyticus]
MGGPLRVLHVVVNMNRGGAETLLMNMYRHIDRSKIQFDFLTCKDGVFDDEIRSLGGIIHRIPYITEAGHRGYLKGLDHFFLTHADYKVVHSHMDKMSGFVLRAARRAAIPMRIAHSHNTSSEGSVPSRIYKWYAGTFVESAATHYVACSKAAARWMFHEKKDNVLILQNGIDCEQFAYSVKTRLSIRKELDIPENCFVAGHVGRFNLQKNHAQLLSMFNQLQNEKPNSILLLVGDGPLRPEMEQKATELGIRNKVIFLGIRSDIHRILQAVDVFVFPSHHEGLPVTLIEAQAAGLPCVISDQITEEVDIGIGLIKYFSLKNEASGLSEILEAAKKPKRMVPLTAFSNNGYDIKQTVQVATSFYLNQFEVNHEDVNGFYAHL